MAKSADSDETNRLTDIVVKEVSLVDRAANKRQFLITKRDGSDMAKKLVADGRGGFIEEVTKNEAAPAAVAPPAAAPAAVVAPATAPVEPALTTEEVATHKAETIAKMGALAERILTITKDYRDKGEAIPETFCEEIQSMAQDITKRRMGKARMDKLETGLATLQELMAELKGESETTKAAAPPAAAPAVPAVPAVAAPAVSDAVTKSLADLKAKTDSQEAEIRKLRQMPARPNSGGGDGDTTPSADGKFAWPTDMASKKTRTEASTF